MYRCSPTLPPVRLLGLQRFRGARLLYLTTVGRKSGRSLTVPLAFVRDGEDYVVAASNGGSDWRRLSNGFACSGDSVCDVEIPGVALDPRNPDVVYIGVWTYFHFQGFAGKPRAQSRECSERGGAPDALGAHRDPGLRSFVAPPAACRIQ